MGKARIHPVVRITHWVNVVALTIMIGSGLRIFNAYPAFARRGETFCCYPWEHKAIPDALTFGGWLAGARNWHFAMMWVLVINGLIYLGFIYLHGEWRDLVPRKSFARDSVEMLKYYLFLRKRHPVQGKYNALQRGTYFILPIVGAVAVLSGIAIWKPVQLSFLTDLMGGYVWARYWHFLAMVALVALSFIHIFMVFAVDPYALRAITTGGYNPEKSPEARNARPFYNLFARGKSKEPADVPRPPATPPPSRPEPAKPATVPPSAPHPSGGEAPAFPGPAIAPPAEPASTVSDGVRE